MLAQYTQKILKSIMGDGGVTSSEIIGLAQRERLSDFLPYLTYSANKETFANIDNTEGYMWECVPSYFQTEQKVKRVEKMLQLKLPRDSVWSFHMYGDNHIKPMLDANKIGIQRNATLVRKSADEYSNHLIESTNGMPQVSEIPVRNFRVFVTLKSETVLESNQVVAVEEGLKSAGLCPRRCNDGDLARLLRRMLNNEPNKPVSNEVSKSKPIRKQILKPGLKTSFPKSGKVRIGDLHARCLTPHVVPSKTNTIKENKLLGGYMGIEDDGNQLLSPFLYTCVVSYMGVQEEFENKAKIMNGQNLVGKNAKELQKRLVEYRWLNDLPEDTVKCRVHQTLWIFDTSEANLDLSVNRAIRIASDEDYTLREEGRLSTTMFLMSLPFGYYNVRGNAETIDRYNILPASSVASILPLQADYSGSVRIVDDERVTNKPVLCLVGRKGQIQGYNVFDKRSNNHNFIITAGSGAGKSFKLNKFVNDYYASGSLVRLIDLGYSFEKSCRINNGRFLDIGKEKMCINPFYSMAKDEEDSERDLISCAIVISEMINSFTGAPLSELEFSLLKAAARWTKKQGNIVKGIDSTRDYLENIETHAKGEKILDVKRAVESAKIMAYNLRDFTSQGVYGRFFNGVSNFNIKDDEFVVVELQQLKEEKELFPVIIMQVINSVTQDLYLGDRSYQRFCLFEEVAQYLRKQGHKDLGRLAMIIEEGYRRARKHNGSFGAVLQSILDLELFGDIGQVIKSNAAYKFYLESEDYVAASERGLITHKGIALEILDSIRNQKPRYSECMIETPFGFGVGRLIVDKWNYWVNTSDGKETQKYYDLIRQGYLPEEAISKLSGIPL
ncbi:TraC family protein [Thalassotalea marina]|uniref:Conjugal transfer protein TraC n=1 Tax=Thalassotalea marina TaxID=1673741 RepID=A0A919BR63_9GAMM|nr:TraC family protein [Thalassotalea marina]GHG07087.1 conjugal transfer protein TraC [Thalassotalea marina]